MHKRILTTIIALSLLSASPVHASTTDKHTHRKYHGLMSDYFYDRLASCETGGNWQHSTRSYTGGLGIYRGTWQRWSNSSSAKGKTPEYQVRVADKIAFLGHTEPNGEFVWAVGVYGWGCVKRTPELQQLICQSKNPKVYRKRRNC
jgi:hypothetical protein